MREKKAVKKSPADAVDTTACVVLVADGASLDTFRARTS